MPAVTFTDILWPFYEGAPNVSLLTIPAALLCAAIPHWYTISLALRHKVQGGWDNRNPRAFVNQLAAKQVKGGALTPVESMILRGQSAQANGFENAALFGLALIVGHYAGLSTAYLNRFSYAWITSRILYNIFYLRTTTKSGSYARTFVFNAGMAGIVVTFFKATFAINRVGGKYN